MTAWLFFYHYGNFFGEINVTCIPILFKFITSKFAVLLAKHYNNNNYNNNHKLVVASQRWHEEYKFSKSLSLSVN